MSETDSHQIQYEHEIVKKFVAELNETLQRKVLKTSGVDDKSYEKLWNQLTNTNLATVYLTVLLGKLLILEEKALKLKQELSESTNANENDQYVDDKAVALQDVIDYLKLGTQKYDPNHPLLSKRKEQKTRNFMVQLDERVSEFVNTFFELNKTSDSNVPNNSSTSSGTSALTADMLTDEDIELTDVITSLQDSKYFSFNTSLYYDGDVFSRAQLHERAAIMLSLIYIASFYRFDFQNASLMSVLQLWKNLRFQAQSDFIGDEILEALCPPSDALYKYMHVCVDYDVVKESDTVLRPTLSLHDPLICIGAIVYERLKIVCANIPRYTDNILNDLITLVMSTCSNRSLLSETYDAVALKNVLNFIKLLLPQLVVSRKSKKLQELMNLLQRFFLEPLPIGGLCHDVLNMCYREQITTGTLMRERFERSIQRSGNDIKRRKIYIFFNGYSQYADHLTERVDLSNEYSDEDIIQCRANLVLNIYDDSSNSEVKKTGKEIEKLAANIISEFYEEVVESSTDDNKLLSILKKMQQIKTHDSVKLVRQQSPKLPEPEIELIQLPDEEDMSKCTLEKKIYPRSVYYTKLAELIEKVKKENGNNTDKLTIDIAIAGGSGTLQRFVHSYFLAQKMSLLTNIDIRIYLLPLGLNNYLSGWLEKYDGWYSRHVHYPLLCKIPVFPHLQTFNKANIDDLDDKRTGRSYVNTRKTSVFIPQMKFTKKDATSVSNYKPNKKIRTPHKFMRNLLNDYFIDAFNTYPVHIYNAQCLVNVVETKISNNPQDQGKTSKQQSTKIKEYISLSFCQRLDIGILAEAHQFQRENKLEGTSTLEEIIDNKQFKFAGTQLNVSYVPMDPTGELNRSCEINEPTKTYNSISIQSCSMFGDRGSLVAPSQPWLETFVEEFGSKRKKKMRDCDIGTSYHVGSITIESSTFQQFSVLMDGEIYGPFHKLIINASSAQQTLKLQTFNNVDIY
ncbi:hypothetical protein ABK040_005745 [Willaertia magna]